MMINQFSDKRRQQQESSYQWQLRPQAATSKDRHMVRIRQLLDQDSEAGHLHRGCNVASGTGT